MRTLNSFRGIKRLVLLGFDYTLQHAQILFGILACKRCCKHVFVSIHSIKYGLGLGVGGTHVNILSIRS